MLTSFKQLNLCICHLFTREIVRFQFLTLTFIHLPTAQHLPWKGLYFERDSSNLMRKTKLRWSNKCASVLRLADMQVDRRSICLKLSLQMQVAHLLFVRFQKVGPPQKKYFLIFLSHLSSILQDLFSDTWLDSQVRSYDQLSFLARSPYWNYNIKLQRTGRNQFLGVYKAEISCVALFNKFV